MEQDFTKGLNVCIGNYGYYNEGSLHDAWITLLAYPFLFRHVQFLSFLVKKGPSGCPE